MQSGWPGVAVGKCWFPSMGGRKGHRPRGAQVIRKKSRFSRYQRNLLTSGLEFSILGSQGSVTGTSSTGEGRCLGGDGNGDFFCTGSVSR
jgi:hypothetical protein